MYIYVVIATILLFLLINNFTSNKDSSNLPYTYGSSNSLNSYNPNPMAVSIRDKALKSISSIDSSNISNKNYINPSEMYPKKYFPSKRCTKGILSEDDKCKEKITKVFGIFTIEDTYEYPVIMECKPNDELISDGICIGCENGYIYNKDKNICIRL